MKVSSLVRGSDEDFRNIFGANSPDEAWEEVRNYCNCLVYTANEKGVFVRTTGFSGVFPVRRITPVSTIGAGDNFNAGIITSIYRKQIKRDQLQKLTQNNWSDIIETAVAFATHVCLSYDNYISDGFARELQNR
jgi:fructokinase